MGIDAAGRPMTYGQMMRNKTTGKMKRPAGRALALLAGFVLLFGAAFAEEEDVDLSELLDLSEVEEDLEEVEILPPDATLLARDKQWHTPAEGSPYKCNHEVCYWTTPMGYTDEAAVWEMLIQPITVLDANQRHQVKIRKEPDKDCTEYTGEVTGASQGVHVLERGEEWSLIEAYSSSPEGSHRQAMAAAVCIQGRETVFHPAVFHGILQSEKEKPLERNACGGVPCDQLDRGFLAEG